jgi:predicted site-specific integrase-resolvase
MESDATVKTDGSARRAIVSLRQWLADTGVTACTAWRWRKKGWLKTINICGRQYLTREAIDEFTRRAAAGDFAQVHKVPARHRWEGP